MIKTGRIEWSFNSILLRQNPLQLSKYSCHKKLMSLKNQLPTLSKLNSTYKAFPEKVLDETDIDSNFYHSILDISTVEIRLVRLSKDSSKNSFTFKVFKFTSSKFQQIVSNRKKLQGSKRLLRFCTV